jgi:hypothetical protein
MARYATTLWATVMLCLFAAMSAHAQATRTWVSGVGDDANPCSRTAPCKTFAGAISKTQASGEIDALDPGGFGAVTITKAITISGEGVTAGVLVAGTNGIVVQAGPTDTVVLRHLDINGVAPAGSGASGPGLNGVRFVSGHQLLVDDCQIYGFSQNAIDIALSAPGHAVVRNSILSLATAGVHVAVTSGPVFVSLDNVHIHNCGTGVDGASANTDISNSVVTQNTTTGLLAETGGFISSMNNIISGNGTGVRASTGSTLRLSNTDILNNTTGILAQGTVASAGNNRNTGNGTPGAPNATITVQ